VPKPHDILKTKALSLDRHAENAGAFPGGCVNAQHPKKRSTDEWRTRRKCRNNPARRFPRRVSNPNRPTVRVSYFAQPPGRCNGRMTPGDRAVAASIVNPQIEDKETVMNYAATAALTLALSLAAGSAFAADAPAKPVTPQQQRMKDCNVQATGKHGDERKAFMSTCLKGSSTAATSAAVPAPASAPKHAASKSKSSPSSGKH
jgi:hypothetical protein